MMNRISVVSRTGLDTMTLMVRVASLAMVLSAFSACTERVNVCNSDSECTDPAYPFCDVNGEYAESGHVAMSCSITPASCPIERCGCVPGLVTCSGDELTTCNADGKGETVQSCALGCGSDRCLTFDPSNGLSTALLASATEPDRTLPDGAVIDTTSGMVTGVAGTIPSVTVAQTGGADIRVFTARSWTISNVRVVGSLPVAFVADDEIRVTGTLDASADGPTSGPGASACSDGGNGTAPGAGLFASAPGGNSGGYPPYLFTINGAGGGGFGTAGGDGGVVNSAVAAGAGGPPNGPASLSPLRGGCGGYGEIESQKGAGGGAIQLVANRRVHLSNGGGIHVGGGGGKAGSLGVASLPPQTAVYGPGGGGSGGGILIEAPSVELDDGALVLAAGGGGGGYGACANSPNGQDAQASAATPSGGRCPVGTTPASGGGAGSVSGSGGKGDDTTKGSAGGGGGGLGRIRVNSADGEYMAGANVVLRGALTTGTLATH